MLIIFVQLLKNHIQLNLKKQNYDKEKPFFCVFDSYF